MDNKNKQIVALEITDEKTHDNAKFGELTEQSTENVENKGGRVIQINADAAYDSNESFRISEEYNIKPVIKLENLLQQQEVKIQERNMQRNFMN